MKKIRFFLLLLIILSGCFAASIPVYAAKVSLNKSNVSLVESKKVKLQLQNTTNPVFWYSTDPSIATVSSKGIVCGISPGFCTIEALCNNKIYFCSVTVKSKKRIVLAGSSTLDFWTNAPQVFSPYRIANMGVTGTKVSPWVRKLYKPLIIDQDPLAVVLYIGANDIYTNTSGLGSETGKQIVSLLKKLHTAMPDVPIFYISINPSVHRAAALPQINQCNSYVQKNCKKMKQVFYLDTCSSFVKNGKVISKYYQDDDLHLSKSGYDLLTQLVTKPVLDYLARDFL